MSQELIQRLKDITKQIEDNERAKEESQEHLKSIHEKDMLRDVVNKRVRLILDKVIRCLETELYKTMPPYIYEQAIANTKARLEEIINS